MRGKQNTIGKPPCQVKDHFGYTDVGVRVTVQQKQDVNKKIGFNWFRKNKFRALVNMGMNHLFQ
jgi:hypothetical protein